jgi:hypothetical protein
MCYDVERIPKSYIQRQVAATGLFCIGQLDVDRVIAAFGLKAVALRKNTEELELDQKLQKVRSTASLRQPARFGVKHN